MTNMRRMTVSFPDDILQQIEYQKKTDRFSKRPYSAVIRHFLVLGLQADAIYSTSNESSEQQEEE